VEIAAMLSQLGCIAVPEPTIRRLSEGRELSLDEERQFAAHPLVGSDLLSRIPRLEGVAEMIAYQHKRFDGSGTPSDDVASDAIPLGARILKTAADFEALLSTGISSESALLRMRTRDGWYDPVVLNAFERAHSAAPNRTLVSVAVEELSPGMILAEDVVLHDGSLLATRGQEVTPALRVRLGSVPDNARPARALKVFTAA
jgi:HD-GYP domain-containing protein (c-di-GMP phosphodiesterase class II)